MSALPLVTLRDILMRYHDVAELLRAITAIHEHISTSLINKIQGHEEGDPARTAVVRDALARLRQACSEVNMDLIVRHIDGPLSRRFGGLQGAGGDLITYRRSQPSQRTIAIELRTLAELISADLETRRFIYIDPEKAQVQDKQQETWASIWQAIPKCRVDSEEAVSCYILGRNTACVFHCMRVAEHGLRSLARRLRISLTHNGKQHPIEFGEWDKIITEIQNKIKAARQIKKGARKIKALEFYSDAGDHCLFMKDIWRNDISHARKTYNDPEALAVLQRVYDFMRFLAQRERAMMKP